MKTPVKFDPNNEYLKSLPPQDRDFIITEMARLERMHSDAAARGISSDGTLAGNRSCALQMRDFFGYALSYPAPDRFQALLSIVSRLHDDEYWPLLGKMWSVEEVIEPNKKQWLKLLQSPRPHRNTLMSEQEKAALAAMPDVIQIWRGCSHPDFARGLSWSTDKAKAEFFATYSCGGRMQAMRGHSDPKPTVVMATCCKGDVLAYFMERGESTVVVNPANIVRTMARSGRASTL